MGWQDDVNATWMDVGRVVGAEFHVTQDGGKLVRRSEEWTVTLEYSAKSTGSIIYGDGFRFYTTTTMKAIPNRKKAKEYEIFREVSNEKAPRGSLDGLMSTLSGDPHPDRTWMLPIYDYTRLLTLFRLIDVPKRWSEKRQAWELQEKERKERPRIEAERHDEWVFQDRLQIRRFTLAALTDGGINARLMDRSPETRRPELSNLYDRFDWIEIPEYPIRWLAYMNWGDWRWFVPDARIEIDSPRISIHAVPLKSFLFRNRIKSVRWKPQEVPGDLSQNIAEYLNHATVTQRMISLSRYSIEVFTEHDLGCWGIRWPLGPKTIPGSNWWECLQEVAGTLLAMPMPTKE